MAANPVRFTAARGESGTRGRKRAPRH